MLRQHLLAVRITLNELNRLNSAEPASCQREAADHAQSHAYTSTSTSCSPTRPCCLRFMRGRGDGATLHTATSTS